MFAKEEEAKTRWCPHARAVVSTVKQFNSVIGGAVGNRTSDELEHPETLNCLGSECMAWRWAKMSPEGYVLVTGTKEAAQTLNGPDWKTGGYCGLAGRPVT